MGHLAQPHRAGQAGAPLEGVQRAHAGGRRGGVAGLRVPFAQTAPQLGQQLVGLFLEDGEELVVHGIHGVDVADTVPQDVVLPPRESQRQGHGAGFLGLGRQPFFEVDGQPLVGGQALEERRIDLPQEAGGKLVQEAADLFGRGAEQLGLAGPAMTGGARTHQGMFERSRQRRQVDIADGGRVACQRMGQGHGGLGHRMAIIFDRPLGKLGDEAARLLVGLVEIDVEQRDADAQGSDDLDGLLGFSLGTRPGLFGIHRRWGFGHRLGRTGLRRRFRPQRLRGLHRRDVREGLRQVLREHRELQGRCTRGFAGRGRGRLGRAEIDAEVVEIELELDRLHAGLRQGLDQVGQLRGGIQRQVRQAGCRQRLFVEVPEIQLEALFSLACGFGPGFGQAQFQVGRAGQVGQALQQRLGGGAILERRKVEFELGFEPGSGRRLQPGGRLGRHLRGRIQGQGLGRQVDQEFGGRIERLRSRARQRDRQARVLQPQRVGGPGQDGGLVAALAAGRNGLGPVAQVDEGVAGEAAQHRVHVRPLRQARIEELLAGPGRIAEVLQPHHAGAALQRVEGAAHHGHVQRTVGRVVQAADRAMGIGDDLARFLDEDVAHLRVVFQAGAALRRGLGRRHGRRGRQLFGRGHPPAGHGRRELGAGGLAGLRVGVVEQRRMSHAQQAGQFGLVRSQRLLGQPLRLLPQGRVAQVTPGRRLAQRARLVEQRHLDGRLAGGGLVGQGKRLGALGLPHHRAQAAGGGVEAEQRLGQLRLHAEHVDQETERPEVVGEAVEGAGLDGSLRLDLGLRQRVDLVAHVQRSLRGLVHAQHRQHATHRGQLRRHREEQLAFGRVAEVLVDLLFDLGQRCAQLLHHAAHGLAIADAAVQLLHPDVQRLRLGARAHLVDTLREPLHAAGEFGLVEFAVLQRGIEVQDAGGHFHGQRGRGRLPRGHGLGHGRLQGARQHVARRKELVQRLAHQGELLGQAADAVLLATRHRRPGVLGRGHPLAGLRQVRRVEAAQAGGFVVALLLFGQAPHLADFAQPRRLVGVRRRLGVGAEEQQVLRQAVRQFGLAHRAGAQLRQQPRGDALGVEVGLQQPGALGLEDGRRQLPQRGQLSRALGPRPGGEVGAQVAHAPQGWPARGAQQGQHLGLHDAARRVVRAQRRGAQVGGQIQPLPVRLPQVGRVDAVGTGQRQRGPVLREQHDGGDRLARQQSGQVVQQRERRPLDHLHRGGIRQCGLGDHALHRALAGAQHVGHGGQAHEFEGAHALVELRSCAAKHRRVDGIDVAAGQVLGVLQVATQRLVGGLQGTAQFAMDPSQRAEVVTLRAVEAGVLGIHGILHRSGASGLAALS